MAKKQSSQYTIRDVPPELDKLLRKNARDEQLSLNQVII
jgi:predicted HicB family RNase H-like nuclease